MISIFKGKERFKQYWERRHRRLNPLDEALLLRQLSLLLNTGIHLADAFEVLGDTMEGPSRELCQNLEADIRRGVSISSAVYRQKDCLSPVTLSLIAVGETTGRLAETVELAGHWAERDSELHTQIKSALIYPCFVLTTNLILGACLLIFILPAFQPLFGDDELPFLTQIVIGGSKLLRNPFAWIVSILLIIEAVLFGTRPEGKNVYYRAMLKIPAVGALLRAAAQARFLSVLAITAKVGLSLTKGLQLAALASGDPRFVVQDAGLQAHIRDGQGFEDYFSLHRDVYGVIVYQTLSLCADTGNFEKICSRISEILIEETEYCSTRVQNLLEPVLMIFVAVSTSVILLSTYLPLAGVLEKLLN